MKVPAAIDAFLDEVHEMIQERFPDHCFIFIIQEAQSARTAYASNMLRSDAVEMMAEMSTVITESPPDNERGTLQ